MVLNHILRKSNQETSQRKDTRMSDPLSSEQKGVPQHKQPLQDSGPQKSTSRSPNYHHTPPITEESVYEFYTHQLLPALMASIPILMYRISQDLAQNLSSLALFLWDFMLPGWVREQHARTEHLSATIEGLWELAAHNNSIAEFLTHSFDANGDGLISANELLNVTEIMIRLQAKIARGQEAPMTFWAWFSREWPLMDWKIGLFLSRTFGGTLMVLFILSVIPGKLHSWSGKILRWPILILTYSLIVVELLVYIAIRFAIWLAENLIAQPRHRALRRKMAGARSYEEWYQYAVALDISQKRDRWQRTMSGSSQYNWALILQLIQDMRTAREKHDVLEAEAVLQQCTRKNVGGIMSEDLFSYTNTGEPKYVVMDFIEEVTKTLHWITDESIRMTREKKGNDEKEQLQYQRRFEQKLRGEKDRVLKSVLSWATLSFTGEEGEKELTPTESQHQVMPCEPVGSGENTLGSDGSYLSDRIPKTLPHFHKEQLIAFLKRARAAYGRTALCLSGGAMMGLYHFGHLQGLMETDCLPYIVSGTSAGSVVGAVLCTRTNDELRRDLVPEVMGARMKCFARSWPDRIRSVIREGHMFSGEDWLAMIQWFTCGLTFQEAYNKTGRVFCITLASTTKKAPPVLLNHITAPHITLASAVVASAAVPGFVEPMRLEIKDPDGTVRSAGNETYFDGSIQHDIPVNGLAEQLNCQFFIAAQCNPHVVPFFFNAKGGAGSPSRWRSDEQDSSWRGGFLLAALEMYLKNDMKSKFRFLHEMEAAVGFTSPMMAQEFVGSITIVPNIRFSDYFSLFTDPSTSSLERYFQVGSVAAYQYAAMIRLHYRIADTIEDCLNKLGAGELRNTGRVKPSRRASFEMSRNMSNVIAQMRECGHSPEDRPSLPEVIAAALNERLSVSESSSVSEDDGDHESIGYLQKL
jgi:predicted acylesterase/phospholipase RssA